MLATDYAYKFNTQNDIIQTLFILQENDYKKSYWQKKAEKIKKIKLEQVRK